MDLGETVPSVCSEMGLTVCAGGSEVSDIREEEEDRLAVALPAVTATDTVCYVCNILLLTVLQACTVASAFWQWVVWCLGVREALCCYDSSVPTVTLKTVTCKVTV
jgi:hypothetical protein